MTTGQPSARSGAAQAPRVALGSPGLAVLSTEVGDSDHWRVILNE